MGYWDYCNKRKDKFLHPTEPLKVIEMHDRQNGHEERLSKLEKQEIQEGVQELIRELNPKARILKATSALTISAIRFSIRSKSSGRIASSRSIS